MQLAMLGLIRFFPRTGGKLPQSPSDTHTPLPSRITFAVYFATPGWLLCVHV